jgi:hypothetical protein
MSQSLTPDESFTITNNSKIKTNNNLEVAAISNMLAEHVRKEANINLETADKGDIEFSLQGDKSLGDEAYKLNITSSGLLLLAHQPAGLFYGLQTIRQLFDRDPTMLCCRPRVPRPLSSCEATFSPCRLRRPLMSRSVSAPWVIFGSESNPSL